MTRVLVVGGGIGGLATAIRLGHAGFDVTLLEKNERVGGKMNTWHERDYSFDTGPSLLTMPFVLHELFTSAGRNLADYLDLLPVEPICRYFWPDGSRLDASSDVGIMERRVKELSSGDAGAVTLFLDYGKKIYDAASGPFMFSEFGSLGIGGILKNLRHLPAVMRIDAMRTLNEAVEEFFVDDRLRQIFNRFATYNGSSPYRAPATLAIIPFVEFSMGGWYPRGGMYTLARALERLATEVGVRIHTNVAVKSLVIEAGEAKGVETETGDVIRAEVVVSNADALYVHEHLMTGDKRERFSNVEPSLAGFVLLLGVRRKWPDLAHHNIFFSREYRAEFEAMFTRSLPSENPTIYVCNTSLADQHHAPEGCSNLFVLVNAPPLSGDGMNGHARWKYNWAEEQEGYRNLIVRRLEESGLEGLGSSIEVEKVITPLDFERRYNAFRGSIYGTSSNSRLAAFLRPPNKSRSVENLYFVGGSSHPGGGIPLVLLSGKIVANMIQREVPVA